MTKKLVWRLSTKPTVDEVTKLLEATVITKEEAKELLLRDEEDIPKDQLQEIKDEMKLLRDLVLAIGSKSTFPNTIYPIIIDREPFRQHAPVWTTPYANWCNTTTFGLPNSTTSNTVTLVGTTTN